MAARAPLYTIQPGFVFLRQPAYNQSRSLICAQLCGEYHHPVSTLLIYHPRYDQRGFSRVSKSWMRYRQSYQLFEELGFFANGLRVERQELAPISELLRAHTPEYVKFVRRKDAEGTGFLDYGDTPAYHGVFDRARLSVGGSLLGAQLIMEGVAAHAFNPSGGLHHAQRDRAGGFCVFNDVVIVARWLQAQGLTRIAVIDIDGHHGDGTQALLYNEPLLTISLHQYDGRFYPGTGRADDIGVEAGRGYTINVPLPRRTGHHAYLTAFEQIVVPALYRYRPEFLLVPFGVDGHADDPLVGLQLTTHTYQAIITRLRTIAFELCHGRMMLFGSGGYNPAAVARCWSIMLGTLADCVPAYRRTRFAELHDAPREEDREAARKVELVIEDVRNQHGEAHGIG